MSLPVDVKFRLEAAARVLERAAKKASDPGLRDQLLKLASILRSAAEGNTEALREVEAEGARAKTIDDVVREIKEWIWKGPSPRQNVPETRRPLEVDFAKRILDPLERFEKLLDEIDRKLMEVLP